MDAAYWRSVAIGLQYENQQLHLLVQQLLGLGHTSHGQPNLVSESNTLPDEVTSENIDGEEEEEIYEEYEEGTEDEEKLSEEYIRFMEQSEKHRNQRDASKSIKTPETKEKFKFGEDLVTDEILDKADEIETDFEKLKEEMSVLYGKDTMKVHARETKAQLKFDQWRDQHKATLWPTIPLNLKR